LQFYNVLPVILDEISRFEEPKMNPFVWKIRVFREYTDAALLAYRWQYLNFFQTNP